MKCEILQQTPTPEKLVCKAARNDYSKHWVGECTFKEIMQGASLDDEIYDKLKKERQSWSDEKIEIEARKRSLISRLLDDNHFGPFEHPEITFAVKGVSRSLMAQLTRHRVGITFDIQSMRYVDFEDASPEPGEGVIAIPELNDPGISGRNAEFSDAFRDMDNDDLLERRQEVYEQSMRDSFISYRELLNCGVAPENARMVLPIGTKVNMVFSLNARTLMHIADMRAAGDAQWEIREMTKEVLELAEEWMPYTFRYYKENLMHRKNRLAP
jgi:thymidylate synthase (FAD)